MSKNIRWARRNGRPVEPEVVPVVPEPPELEATAEDPAALAKTPKRTKEAKPSEANTDPRSDSAA
jgi:hypothetical protein